MTEAGETADPVKPEALVVLCACPPDIAERIARTVVEERLAACVSRIPGLTSTYRWQGRVEEAIETLLVIKTSAGAYERLERRICALHPYELPEVIAVPIDDGLTGYLEWIASQSSG